ncbi:hypothetical protein WICPIJ_004026 [Wickerhamomyces pijperi]|uniref:Major facilitator superfamily (MFS) profile domain-containing protein n=1 Tax=Wickerhamomyces pijperi TaxID=599730 RepID=A0A9P8TNA5_WICPI|nr:hypothetical protein WICPIJ_004026 [Wickerhamomyces pijperi]
MGESENNSNFDEARTSSGPNSWTPPGSSSSNKQEDNSIKTRRRSSLIPTAGLNLGGFSAIPEPIMESLPNTPGLISPSYEEEQDITLLPLSKKYIPSQAVSPGIETLSSSPIQERQNPIRPRLKKNTTTTTTLTKLLGEPEEIDENVLSIMNPAQNFYRVICACCWTFVLGMSDGCLGALLPSIEKYYKISYALVSLIWLGTAIGFIIIAFTAHLLENQFGKHVMLTVSCVCFTICYSIVASGLPFPGVVIGFLFAGLGGAIGLSQYNIFMSKLLNGSKYLGIFHGTYGVGATVSPLIATAMLNRGVIWHYFFLIPLGVSVVNVIFTFVTFKGCDEDLKRWEHVDHHDEKDEESEPVELEFFSQKKGENETPTTNNLEATIQEQNKDTSAADSEEASHDFMAALKDYRTWLVCAFIFFYQGTEVSIGGWVVTFLLEYRHGSPTSTGYVASGFWGGVAVGRLVLTHNLCRYFKVRRTIIVLSALIICLDVLAWLVPSAIASAVFSCGIGLCIGPIYPMMVSLITRILPRKIRFCAMTLGTAFGSSGGSAIPFAIGIASQFTVLGQHLIDVLIFEQFRDLVQHLIDWDQDVWDLDVLVKEEKSIRNSVVPQMNNTGPDPGPVAFGLGFSDKLVHDLVQLGTGLNTVQPLPRRDQLVRDTVEQVVVGDGPKVDHLSLDDGPQG